MDIQQIIDQVSAAVADAPEKMTEIAADPQGAIEGIVGQSIDGIDPAEILAGVQEQAQGIDFSAIVENLPSGVASIAENLPTDASGIADAAKGILGGFFNK